MKPLFDRQQLRRAFSRAADGYAESARLQRGIEDRLLEQLDYLDDKKPQRILDLGCGPGRAAGIMKKRWPRSQVVSLDLSVSMLRKVPHHWWRPIHRVCADASALPLADGQFDLVFSNLCVQWVDDLPSVLNELRRVMKPGGLLVFSSFGPDTLWELRQAYVRLNLEPPVSPFAPIQAIGDALVAARFQQPVLDRDSILSSYKNVRGLLRELKQIGATDARESRPRGLAGKDRQRALELAYREETQQADASVPATWEIICAMAWAPAANMARREHGAEIASFDANQIPIRRKPRD